MENPNIQKHYEEARKNAKEFYRTIGHIWCPMLNDYVVFKSAGLRHLIRKNGKPRSERDQMRRFLLLNSAPGILADPTARVIQREKNEMPDASRGTSTPPSARFLTITAQRNEKIITIVVRQIRDGKRNFLSIYDQKIAQRNRATL